MPQEISGGGRRSAFREVSDAVDGEAAVVGDEVDAQGAFAGALDEDVDVGGEGLLGFVFVLRAITLISTTLILLASIRGREVDSPPHSSTPPDRREQ